MKSFCELAGQIIWALLDILVHGQQQPEPRTRARGALDAYLPAQGPYGIPDLMSADPRSLRALGAVEWFEQANFHELIAGPQRRADNHSNPNWKPV